MSRYSRLLELNDITTDKLNLLKSKKVLIIGVGGVGQHVATYLATNGVTNLTIVDYDKVELSNLNRQILLTELDLGKLKVDVVKSALLSRNSDAHINSINLKVDESNIDELVKGYDLIIDAVDNWKSKLIIAKACKDNKVPFLHIGVDGYKGQYCLFINKSLLDIAKPDIISSPKDGVLGPMVGIISSLASMLAIKYLLGEFSSLNKIYYFDYNSYRLVEMLIS
jgi:adenylyltransferase/sulfurtransferase